MNFTILGSTGFIGSRLKLYLESQGYTVFCPERSLNYLEYKNLGNVFFAVGLTGDFRKFPYQTVDAHVTILSDILKRHNFDSLLYFSTTRIYSSLPPGIVADENITVPVRVCADSLYDLSKMLGEALCLSSGYENVRIARLSNVYGKGQSSSTFLGSIMDDVNNRRSICIGESQDSSKDYVFVDDILGLLEKISISGKEKIYNVSSGCPITHIELMRRISEITDCKFSFSCNARKRAWPLIQNTRAAREFDFKPTHLFENLFRLIQG